MMEMRRASAALLAAAALVSGFNVLMVCTAFSPCPPPAMKCVATTNVIAALMGAACVILAVSALLAWRRGKAPAALFLLGTACTMGAILMPWIMGGCMKADMRCRVYTFPYVYAASTVCLVLQAAAVVVAWKKGAGEDGE